MVSKPTGNPRGRPLMRMDKDPQRYQVAITLALQTLGWSEEKSYHEVIKRFEHKVAQNRASTYRKKMARPLRTAAERSWIKNMALAYAIVLQPPSKDLIDLCKRVIDLLDEIDERAFALTVLIPTLFRKILMPDYFPSPPDLIPSD